MTAFEYNNSDDQIDIRDVIERFEELDDMRVPRYVAGWNMPGYMPDSEPHEFDDADDALEYIKDTAKETIGQFATGADSDELMTMLAELDRKERGIDSWQPDEDGEFGQTFGNRHYWIARDGFTGLDESETEEHAKLQALLEELAGNGGDEQWRGEWYPSTLIRESYFKQAMDDMINDCYDLPELPEFMTITLDYRALQSDYSSVEIDGITYFYR